MDLKFDGLDQAALLDSDKVNNGVWVHLDSAQSDPTTGKPLKMYLNGDPAKPQRVLVRSYRCQLIQAAEAKQQKDGFVRVRLAKKAERDDVIAENSLLSDAKRFGLMLAGLDNFSAAGGVQLVSPADGEAIYGMTAFAAINQQVRETAYDDSQYLATADTEAGNASTLAKTPAPETSEV